MTCAPDQTEQLVHVMHHAPAYTLERRGYQDQQLAETLEPEVPGDEREAVAMEFVRQTGIEGTAVTDGSAQSVGAL
jgi:hypothetical protein